MAKNPEQQERLSRFIELAQDYKGWSRNQLAKALGRDATKIVPESGNPKLDLVSRLADVLEWAVGDVAELLVGEEPDSVATAGLEGINEMPWRPAMLAGQAARSEGNYDDAIAFARRAFVVAGSADERASACNLESISWDGLGRFSRSLDAVRRGLMLDGISVARRVMLRSNLANAHYTLWCLEEGRAIASELISRSKELDAACLRSRGALAFAFYVRGNCFRRQASVIRSEADEQWSRSQDDLQEAAARYRRLKDEADYASYEPIARVCESACLEARVGLGEVSAEDAIEQFDSIIEEAADLDAVPPGDWLEYYGWTCIFASNIALRYLSAPDQQRPMAVFTNKAYEISDRLDNWAMRERAFTLENSRRQGLSDLSGEPVDWLIDTADVKVITGTMGRFPQFRRTGWEILETARVVRGN